MRKDISVVMAIYNGRRYINEQLRSIVMQTEKVNQIIIIDDCSPDSCKDIIDECLKDYLGEVVYKTHKNNKGYAQTFFEALSMATGDYIFLSDQDDIWKENKVESCIKIMQSNSNILCLSSLNIIIDGDGKTVKTEKRINKKLLSEVYLEELVKQNKLRPGMSLVVRKEIKEMLAEVDTTKFQQHDRLIEYLALLKNGFYVLNEYLTYYRIHDSNTSGLNLSYFKPRTNKIGRLEQIDKEVKYLNLIRNIEPSNQKLIDKYIHFFNVRKELLQKNNCFLFLLGTLGISYGYVTIRVWLGDLRSIIKG